MCHEIAHSEGQPVDIIITQHALCTFGNSKQNRDSDHESYSVYVIQRSDDRMVIHMFHRYAHPFQQVQVYTEIIRRIVVLHGS